MKITRAEIVVCSPTRNFVTLMVHTDEGIHGIGDATLNGRELAVASYLQEYCVPCLTGRDPFDIAIHNFGIQEHMPHEPLVDEVFPHAYRFSDGYMSAGDAPGLGVDIDVALAKKHPYQRAFLPVNRLEDGTMWNW
jgi:L-alanine-DL-glutamate epimerase-like enolase superfamily enzyme